ncbi:MAG: nucleotidyltransferase family protein [Phycisphaerales bacterium]|nr:nucleotidyltransferase family protein [Phycisphaerales bacterium]
MNQARTFIPAAAVTEFCRRWKIAEFALFGSVLRDDFGPQSDLDVVIKFHPGAGWSYFHLFDMQDELERIVGRPVDLITQDGLKNPARRAEILGTRHILYAA